MKVFVYDNDLILTNYIVALKSANLTPVFTKDLSKIDDCDALLLTGGGNIYPAFYGKPDLFDNYDYLTDISEFYLLKRALFSKKPIVGVCKGMQVINVFFNGTLEDVNSKDIKNHYTFEKDLYHEIITKDNKRLIVNSMHKQRIKDLGESLVGEAPPPDKTIEAISCKTYKILGVQFHPERMNNQACIDFYKKAFNY